MATEEELNHPASPGQIERAIARGDTVFSPILATSFPLLVTFAIGGFLISAIGTGLGDVTRESMRVAAFNADTALIESYNLGLFRVGVPTLAALALVLVCAVLSSGWQLGWRFGRRPVFNSEPISPPANLKRLFSIERIGTVAFSFTQIAVMVGLLCYVSRHNLNSLIQLWNSNDMGAWADQVVKLSRNLVGPFIAAIFLFGAIDYGWQRWMFYRRHRMSDRQIRDELRNDGGNGIAARRRRRFARRDSLPSAERV